jgi:integrase
VPRRTFPIAYGTTGYVEPLRKEDASLSDAVAEYLADVQQRLKPTTLRTYTSYLNRFIESIGDAQLRHLTPLPVKAFITRYARNGRVHAAHNAAIALKALSSWLAAESIFFGPGGIPTLLAIEVPAVPKTSRPAYTSEEVLAIEQVIAMQPNAVLLSAIHWLQLATGIRSNETRLLRLRDVSLPTSGNEFHGHITIREDTTKTAAGVREIPLDQRAAKAIRRYIADGRGRYRGEDEPPLFLTDEGVGFSEGGWHCMHQRLRKRLAERGIVGYKQHRNRNTWARDALEAGVPETAIVQMGGWGSVDMLRRYHGKLSTAELARYPTTLSKYGRR